MKSSEQDIVSPSRYTLKSGRIQLGLTIIAMVGIRLFDPERGLLASFKDYSEGIILLYALAVLVGSFFIPQVKARIYILVIIGFVLLGLDYILKLHIFQFAINPRVGLLILMSIAPWYFNHRLHLGFFFLFFFLSLVTVSFITADPEADPVKFIFYYLLICTTLFVLVGSRIDERIALINRDLYNQNIFERLNEGLLISDKHGKIIKVNQKFCEMVGYSRAELKEEVSLAHLVAEEDLEILNQKIQERQTGEYGRYEIRMVRKDGALIWMQVSASPNIDADGFVVGSTAIMIDITDKKAAEMELDNYSQVLAYTNKELAIKNSELEQFATIATTDLRLPLEKINHAGNVLKSLLARPDPLSEEYIDTITHLSSSMQNLLDSMLVYSESQAGTMEKKLVDLQVVLDEIQANMKDTLRVNNTHVHYEQLPTILVDRIQIQRLFRNLIENSITYRGNNPLDINISYSIHAERDEYIFSIEDNGSGIKREDYEKIFSIFRKDSELQESGVGMGLAVSKKIASNHEGRLWFTSNVGKGTTFFLSLPSQASTTEKSEPSDPSASDSIHSSPPQNLQ